MWAQSWKEDWEIAQCFQHWHMHWNHGRERSHVTCGMWQPTSKIYGICESDKNLMKCDISSGNKLCSKLWWAVHHNVNLESWEGRGAIWYHLCKVWFQFVDIIQLWILIVLCLQNSFSRYNLTLPPEDTVKRMLLGQPYSLECYRSHEDKLAVLDTALATLDGSAILATIFHLKNTVKKNMFVKVPLHVLCVSVVIKCCLFLLMLCYILWIIFL